MLRWVTKFLKLFVPQSLRRGILRPLALHTPFLRAMILTRGTAWETAPWRWFVQKLVGVNRSAYWPMHPTSKVRDAQRIRTGRCCSPGLNPWCYIQGTNGIELGDYTLLGPGVGLISANHSVYDFREHDPSGPIRIGAYCWIGMNAVVLPGVVLGDHTIVAAGAVVSKSFPDGYCVLGGVRARVLKQLDRERVVRWRAEHEYVGYHELRGRDLETVYRQLGVALPPPPEPAGEPAADD
jgi:acetyltransferase-like isoleucine patch superfamily enzyme